MLIYEHAPELAKVMSEMGISTSDPQYAVKRAEVASAMATHEVTQMEPFPPPPGPTPVTPTQFMPAQQYMDNLNDWLQAHNDTNPNSGIEQNFAIPLGNAINSLKLTNFADIQNWLKTSPDGQKAMNYMINSNIYKSDPALAALSPSAAQGELQKLFNSLLMPVKAPTPPGPPSFDPNKAVDSLWKYNGYGVPPNTTDIPQVYMQHAAGFQQQLATYNAEVAKYNNMSPQQKAAEWPTLQNMYNVTYQGYNNSSGYDLLYGGGPGVVSDEACRIIGLPTPMTRDQATAIGKVMDSRYLGSGPVLPPPPGPPGPTPAQSTAAIYGDKKMTPSFHDQFMALPIMKEIGQYQADLAAYNKNPTQSGYMSLMAEFNKVQGDVSGGLTPSVLQLLQKNSAEIQSLGINPLQFSDIANYIVGTQEKGNIPAIAPPTPPGPPTDDVQWLFDHDQPIQPLYNNNVVQMTRQIKVGSPSDISSLVAAHLQQYKDILKGQPLPPGRTIDQLATELLNKEWTASGGQGLPPFPGPPTPTPAQETGSIYGDKNMKPAFHDQFMNSKVFTDIKQYQADLAAYNKNPTQSGYNALMAEFNTVQGELNALPTTVLNLLRANSAEIQSLGINPGDFAAIANYIVSTQEKGNIPAIAPPNPPGPPTPVPPAVKNMYDNEVAQLKATLANEGPHGPNVLKLLAKHRNDYIGIIGAGDPATLNAIMNSEWTAAGGTGPCPLPPL
jgi:hypothetical protein